MTYDGNMWYDGVGKLKDATLLEALQLEFIWGNYQPTKFVGLQTLKF